MVSTWSQDLEISQILGKALGYPKSKDQDGVDVGQHTVATLAAEIAQRYIEATWNSSTDTTLPEDAAIAAAHPTSTGRHDRYVEAMRIVESRRGKHSLVQIVNWLMACRDNEAEARASLRRRICDIREELTVEAAEYVPAIADALRSTRRALDEDSMSHLKTAWADEKATHKDTLITT